MDVVISTANRIIPQKSGDNTQRVNANTLALITACELAGVKRFVDVFIVMGGFLQAKDASHHATTKRQFGFTKLWSWLTGNLVVRVGVFLAPGGAHHGTPIIATKDVAEMLVGGASAVSSRTIPWRGVATRIPWSA